MSIIRAAIKGTQKIRHIFRYICTYLERSEYNTKT